MRINSQLQYNKIYTLNNYCNKSAGQSFSVIPKDTVSFGSAKKDNSGEKIGVFKKLKSLLTFRKPANTQKTSASEQRAIFVYNDGVPKGHYAKLLKKLDNFTIADYKKLTPKDLVYLRKKYRKAASCSDGYIKSNTITKLKKEERKLISFWEVENIHDRAVNYIKEYLDKHYGEGKYKVIIVGRSLSSIGKCLGYRIGEENIINLPLSEADRFLMFSNISKEKKLGGIDVLKEYLKEKGLTKESLENSDKEYIIMDYCYSGNSLKGVYNLLNSSFVFHNNQKLDYLDVYHCIPDKTFSAYLWDVLCDAKLKKLASVDKCFNLSSIPNSFVDLKSLRPNYRLLLFKLMDNQLRTRDDETNQQNVRILKKNNSK